MMVFFDLTDYKESDYFYQDLEGIKIKFNLKMEKGHAFDKKN